MAQTIMSAYKVNEKVFKIKSLVIETFNGNFLLFIREF